MSAFLTSSSLIASVKRRAMIPSSQSTFSDEDFLALANEEVAIGMVPSILMYHEEYYVYPEVAALVADKSAYPIPYRAVGGKLRNLEYLDTSNNVCEMTRISPDDAPYFGSNNNGNFVSRFYARGNDVVLVPSVSSSPVGSLLFSYYLRPNELVKESRVAIVTAIDTVTGIITVDKTPTNITASSLIDFLEYKPGHRTRSFDITVAAVDAINKTITFTPSDVPSDLIVGDHIATAGECMIPQIPSDLHSVLAQRVAARCLEALGDTQGLTNANTKLQEMELKTGMLIDNRSTGNPLKINNIRGLLRSSKIGRRF